MFFCTIVGAEDETNALTESEVTGEMESCNLPQRGETVRCSSFLFQTRQRLVLPAYWLMHNNLLAV